MSVYYFYIVMLLALSYASCILLIHTKLSRNIKLSSDDAEKPAVVGHRSVISPALEPVLDTQQLSRIVQNVTQHQQFKTINGFANKLLKKMARQNEVSTGELSACHAELSKYTRLAMLLNKKRDRDRDEANDFGAKGAKQSNGSRILPRELNLYLLDLAIFFN